MSQDSQKIKPHILVIDDDPGFSHTMKRIVEKLEYICHTAGNLKEGLLILEKHPVDLVFLDVCLPDGNGVEHIGDILGSPHEPDVIMLTGKGDPDGAELAIQKGVFDYLVKPTSLDDTRNRLNRALKYRFEKKPPSLMQEVDFSRIVGRSPALSACFKTVAQASKTDSNVLVTGETGTGKELFARTIHENSRRAKGPFVVVDCASLTKSLVESILFGHKKGSFTGASSDRTGLVESAHNGTLFLDEIGELPLSIQKTFLRVLQEKRFRPVGDTVEIHSNFRLIAATNRNLESMVSDNSFRQDLLFRLKTMPLPIPPLRERPGDIPILSTHYIRELCGKFSLPEKKLGQDALDVLLGYSWPGNVRQLFNALERAVITSGENNAIYSMDLPQEIRIEVARSSVEKSMGVPEEIYHNKTAGQAMPIQSGLAVPDGDDKRIFDQNLPDLKRFKNDMERRYLEELRKFARNDIKRILEISGLSRSHYYALLKKNRLAGDDGADPDGNPAQ
jgi:two-component system NtrC family response regulator